LDDETAQRNPTFQTRANMEIIMATKTVNYTPEQTAEMVSAYVANPSQETVVMFAEKFGKTVRSVVAKLSREKVYVAKTYETKNGEKPIKKDAHADAIGAVLKLTEAEIESLTKANKSALVKIFAALANSQPIDG
jgi:Holliday junction resolvase